jgi:hypothetical protein
MEHALLDDSDVVVIQKCCVMNIALELDGTCCFFTLVVALPNIVCSSCDRRIKDQCHSLLFRL